MPVVSQLERTNSKLETRTPGAPARVRAGVAGVGSLGQHHARIYASLPGAELAGVFDANETRAAEIAARHGCRQFTSLEELADRNNKFNRIMMSVSQNRQAVLMFWVNPSSFNTYLRARPYADQNHVAAGWEVRGNESYWIPLTDFEVKRLKTPPPPPAIPPKPGPPGIKPTLD